MMIHDASIAYEACYNAIVRLIGLDMTIMITKKKIDSLDKSRPVESIQELLNPLTKMFGSVGLKRIVRGALEKHFTPDYVDKFLEELNL